MAYRYVPPVTLTGGQPGQILTPAGWFGGAILKASLIGSIDADSQAQSVEFAAGELTENDLLWATGFLSETSGAGQAGIQFLTEDISVNSSSLIFTCLASKYFVNILEGVLGYPLSGAGAANPNSATWSDSWAAQMGAFNLGGSPVGQFHMNCYILKGS